MPEIAPNPNVSRPRWLTDAQVELDVHASVQDPTGLGITARPDETVTVPAIFEMPGTDGEMSRFALVRHETPGGDVSVALHGLVRNRRGVERVANRRGYDLGVGADNEKPHHVLVGGEGDGAISQSVLFERRHWSPLRRRRQTSAQRLGHGALDLMITPQGGVFASVDQEGQVARIQAARIATPQRFVVGRVGIGIDDVRHAEYESPEDRASRLQAKERQRLEQQRASEQAETDRVAAIFAPRNVPDVTAGQQVPMGYEGPVVTPESRQWSRDWLSRAQQNDSRFSEIVESVTGVAAHLQEADALMDSIRTNEKLRRELGDWYRRRIEFQLTYMGHNIQSRAWKRPASAGYEGLHMKGPEYAAVLALAHLDGTFNPTRESVLADTSNLNAYGWPTIDQHRAAARYAIDGLMPLDRQKAHV